MVLCRVANGEYSLPWVLGVFIDGVTSVCISMCSTRDVTVTSIRCHVPMTIHTRHLSLFQSPYFYFYFHMYTCDSLDHSLSLYFIATFRETY